MLKIKRKQILAAVITGTLVVTGVPITPNLDFTTIKVEAAKKKNGWSGSYYYKNGKKVKGLKKIGKYYYYFDSKGKVFKKGWKTIKGKRYYFGKNKRAYTGVKRIGKSYYLFNSKGQRTGTGIFTYKGKKYYTKSGVIKTGLVTVKGKKYYSTRSGLKSGWVTIKGKQYYFNPKTKVMTKNKWVGNKYVGKNGYVTKTKGNSNSKPNNSNPSNDSKPSDSNNKPSNDSKPSYNKNDYWGDVNRDPISIKLEVNSDGIYRFKNSDGTYQKNTSVVHVVNGKETWYEVDSKGYAITGFHPFLRNTIYYNGSLVTDKATAKKALLTISEFKSFKNNYLKDGMSDVDKLFAVQSFIIDQNFVYDANQGMKNTSIMTFFETKRGMCNDWSRLVYLLSVVAELDCEPAIYDYNPGHAANIVKIDGVWYHLDFNNSARLEKDVLDIFSANDMAERGIVNYSENQAKDYSFNLPLATSHNYTAQSYMLLKNLNEADKAYFESQGCQYKYGCCWVPEN